MLMCMGYLGEIGFFMNDLRSLANFVQKSYEKILVRRKDMLPITFINQLRSVPPPPRCTCVVKETTST